MKDWLLALKVYSLFKRVKNEVFTLKMSLCHLSDWPNFFSSRVTGFVSLFFFFFLLKHIFTMLYYLHHTHE